LAELKDAKNEDDESVDEIVARHLKDAGGEGEGDEPDSEGSTEEEK
jgi:hypothetical protein